MTSNFEHPSYLFHGTDMKVFLFSDEGRLDYFESCWRVLNHINPFYERLGPFSYQTLIDAQLDDEVVAKIQRAARDLHSINQGNHQYEYGDLYLHSSIAEAWSYALNSYGGGELGTNTYNLILGAEALKYDGWNTDMGLMEEIASIKAFAAIPPEPVLFIFPWEEMDASCIKQDTGAELSNDNCERYRYLKQVDLYYYEDKVLLPKEIKDPKRYKTEELISLLNRLRKNQG